MLDQLDTMIAFALVMLLLGLLITTLVQSFNVVLQRRGFNLAWGVQQILEQMDVTEAEAKTIAESVLKDPSLSGNVWWHKLPGISWLLPGYAPAIRLDELARVLQRITPLPAPASATKILEAADALLKTLAADSRTLASRL